jgi:hypothetical protein
MNLLGYELAMRVHRRNRQVNQDLARRRRLVTDPHAPSQLATQSPGCFSSPVEPVNAGGRRTDGCPGLCTDEKTVAFHPPLVVVEPAPGRAMPGTQL